MESAKVFAFSRQFLTYRHPAEIDYDPGMDQDTLIAAMEFSYGRLLGTLKTVEQSGQDTAKVLAWRPGPGRAHIGWQAMHCAATVDRYVNVRLRSATPKDEPLVAHYCSGTNPSDENIPTLAEIRRKLAETHADLLGYVRSLKPSDLSQIMELPNNVRRSVAESIILLTWHEAHHQGQIHLTWNLYKQAHGL